MKTRIVHLPQAGIVKEDPFPNKVSLDELRKIWDDDHYTYTDDELMRIREWLYAIAAITIRLASRKSYNNINSEQHENRESPTIPSCRLDRAS